MKEDRFGIWYKNKIESGNALPPDDVWNNISEELDIEDVWHDVSGRLRRGSILRYSAVITGGLSIIFVTTILLIQQLSERSEITLPFISGEVINNTPGEKIITIDNQRPALPPVNNEQIDIIVSTLNKDKSDLPEEVGLKTAAKVDTGKQIERETTYSEPIQPVIRNQVHVSSYLLMSATDKIQYELPSLTLSGSNMPEIDPNHRFAAGIFVSGKNSWLFNNKTIQGLKRSGLNSTLPYFVTNAGFRLMYDLNQWWVIQGEGIIHSEAGQNYKEYLHGEYLSRQIALNYWELGVQVRYRINIKTRPAGIQSHSLSAGPYFAGLWEGLEWIGENENSITDQYESYDFGLIIGYEFEYPLLKKLSVSPGARIHLGFPNIYKGDGTVPATLRLTRTVSFELFFGLDYKF